MRNKPTPHQLHRSTNVHGIFWFLFAFMVVVYMFGCSPKYGCRETSGKNYKVGYHPKK
jgi:hypothetical protein